MLMLMIEKLDRSNRVILTFSVKYAGEEHREGNQSLIRERNIFQRRLSSERFQDWYRGWYDCINGKGILTPPPSPLHVYVICKQVTGIL